MSLILRYHPQPRVALFLAVDQGGFFGGEAPCSHPSESEFACGDPRRRSPGLLPLRGCPPVVLRRHPRPRFGPLWASGLPRAAGCCRGRWGDAQRCELGAHLALLLNDCRRLRHLLRFHFDADFIESADAELDHGESFRCRLPFGRTQWRPRSRDGFGVPRHAWKSEGRLQGR